MDRPHFEKLLKRCEGMAPLPTAVVSPESPDSLEGTLLAAKSGLVAPLLIGDAKLIRQCADQLSVTDIDPTWIIDCPDHAEAAGIAVTLVHEGRAKAVMKGNLHTDTFLRPIVTSKGGIRQAKRISHVFAMDIPSQTKLFLITDAAINIAPDLETKAAIAQNALDLANSLGIEEPKLAVLSAVETINDAIPSSVEAGALAKMAKDGFFSGGLVDGPFALDNAVCTQAAKIKGVESPVAGHADILLVPFIEAGNMMYKQLVYMSNAEAAGLVLGAKVPVILTSRADSAYARQVSCALAVLHANSTLVRL